MKANHLTPKSFSLKTLAAAITACAMCPQFAHSGPTGGAVVDGGGAISQSGTYTRVDQDTQRLSLEWETFNVNSNERVEFVQPNSSAVALNRILDNAGSQILGRIDANGHVILMNPNGVFFGRDAVVNVGGLVASGLNISSEDFMNGELVFAEVAGSTGVVVNRGIINASTGGNVALLGKSVANHGVITAELGHVALAAGSEAVVSFDEDGLIGVRIDRETLSGEVSGTYAVNNAGTINANGGKILLNASVSADLFSEAVNHGGMNGDTAVVLHDDGSFTLGAGNGVINTGTLDVSTDAGSANDAGYVVVAGDQVEQRGTIRANASGENLAGQVYVEAYNQVRLNASTRMEANAEVTSGKVSVSADYLHATGGATVSTTGNTYLNGNLSARAPELTTNHLYVSGLGSVTQAGAATVSGNTHLKTASGGSFRMNNAGNDFNTVSITTNYNDNIVLADSNDIALGNIAMEDSSLRVDALGDGATIRQVEGTNISLSAGTFRMNADNVILGEGGSTTRLAGASFLVEFRESIATNGSVSLLPYNGFDANYARITGRDSYDNSRLVELRGDKNIDLNASLSPDSLRFDIERMTGSNATLNGGGALEAYQTGPITLSGTLTWNSYRADLTNPENDIFAIRGNGGAAFGGLNYVDKNDLLIRDIKTGPEVGVSLSSVGEGATLRQLSNTTLKADLIDLSADNIILGANGRSKVEAGYDLRIKFGNTLEINGPWIVHPYSGQGPMLSITGDERDNRLIFGPHATNTAFEGSSYFAFLNIDLLGGDDIAIFDSAFPVGADPETWSTVQLDMGEGNDRVIYNRDVQIPLLLGTGEDTLQIRDNTVYHDVLDFDASEDRLVVTNP